MELSRVGADLLGQTEAALLSALARLSDPVTGRRLAALAGQASPATVHRLLSKFERAGLVLVQKHPHAHLYRLNREHLYWQPIEDILAAPAQLEQAIVERVHEELGDRARVALFGSVARGEATSQSDVDVLVVPPGDVSVERREVAARGIEDLILAMTGNPGQVVHLNDDEIAELDRHHSPLVRSIRASSRPIDGRGPFLPADQLT
ncbi:nucleotidyltransferase domain-containing protein [Salinibacterium soli]|uniref:Nucleotidyltransferase domain-containing protein n=1 Tax=Antiquaquibacter soli TaxID=3064523 RepID=A0ABT9BRA4_9MICO|nr:nucleotidyltransferase domain-containing protein [Protaetiibacter sp. WY-16]MDO7883475.1 nucleotidyltransferase domain-containing protein [Protaetiibacter sp. WY-16]